MTDAEDVHPPATDIVFFLTGLDIESHGVFQSTGNDTDGWDVLLVATVHLWRHITDVSLDVPDTLAGTSLMAEERNVTGITLWIVCTHQG